MPVRVFPLLYLTLAFVTLIGIFQSGAQSLSLAMGLSGGYAPVLNYGTAREAGAEIAIFGDIEYARAIARLQFTDVLAGTVDNDKLESGYAIHGSLGYKVPVSAQVFVPVMLTGGAGFVRYHSGFGSGGNTYFDASPQIGLTISPCWNLSESLVLQLAARYIHGFAAGVGSYPVIMSDVMIGIRYSLL
ncbi:MAG: hypothetical protein KDC28_11810 [Saprospiraceae bacterium]|nr:hypothetical protein [Saprospiraceae bacterium]MCB9319722.1 hypothetical protein [Lewinellaceae bacterium]